MKSTLKIQKDGVNTLKEEILSHSNSKLKKIYVITSNIKETGYDIIEECLIDLKARKFIAFGIDKKNTTRKMLENVLKYTKNVYIWDNNASIEFNSNIYIFEYESEAFVYIAQGSVTDSMMETDLSIYTILSFDLIKDKKEYEEYMFFLTKEIKDTFKKLTKEYIDELAEQKLIFTTKQYMHVIPSIDELLGKSDDEGNKENHEVVTKIPKVNLDQEYLNSFEIDLGENSFEIPENKKRQEIKLEEDIETQAFGLDEKIGEIEEKSDYVIDEEVIDMEAIVLENDVVKLNKADIEKNRGNQKPKVKEKQLSKKINLSNVSNIIMQLGLKPLKGKDVNKIKIPNYIKDIIPQFFEIMDQATVIKVDNVEYKEAKIKLELIDVNTSNKYVDSNACLRQKAGQTYIEFESCNIEKIMYEELDIARVIKLAQDSYHIEIIPQGIEEYSLWDKMCTNDFKGSNRQYGLM